MLTGYADRDELGRLANEVSATFNDERLDVLRAGEKLEADVSGIDDPSSGTRRRRASRCASSSARWPRRARRSPTSTAALKDRWFERLLGPEREEVPSSSHVAYLRRLSPLEAIYTKERAVPICMDTLARLGFDLEHEPNIKLDLDDRPQKSPRACVIPADPPKIVHLITRAQGGLHDYQAFLHEAGHALHYAGCDPSLPYTFRNISRDHALTEIYSYIVEAISRQPGWHARYFGLSDEEAEQNAEATVFMEALLFRRYAAKLQFELDFWGRFARGRRHRRRLRRAADRRDRDASTGARATSPTWTPASTRPTTCAPGSARRSSAPTSSARSARSGGPSKETGDRLRELFREGTKPSSEEIAGRIGFEPLDTGPLRAELGA